MQEEGECCKECFRPAQELMGGFLKPLSRIYVTDESLAEVLILPNLAQVFRPGDCGVRCADEALRPVWAGHGVRGACYAHLRRPTLRRSGCSGCVAPLIMSVPTL
jgi:hypothetical protein